MTDEFKAAKQAWKKHRLNMPAALSGPVAVLDKFFNVPLRRLPPDAWRVGDIVEYERSSEWAWSKGTIGRIVEIRKDDIGKSPDAYQVFWVSPLDGGSTWWTTPDDVQFVRRPE